MGIVEVIILAIVQGLTEFLPVSSSGHLVVAGALLESLGYAPPQDLLEVNIALHVGTLLAIILFYWRRILDLVGRDRRVILLLAVGTLPAAAVGVPLKRYAEDILTNPTLAGAMFALTALLLWVGSRQDRGTLAYRELSYWGAVRIGLWQALALLPGVSRSGATIAAGLTEGLDRTGAATFAFLLALPAIGGAAALELADLAQDRAAAGGATSPAVLAMGVLVAMLVGFGALTWLIRWVEQGRLALFVWYLIPLSVAVVIWQTAG